MDTLNDMIQSEASNAQGPSENNMEGFDFQPSENVNGPSDFMGSMNSFPLNNNQENMNNFSEPMDEEEIQRMEKRKQEEDERRRKIEEKQNLELKQKNELREEARNFMDEFEAKRQSTIAKRKELNVKNEKEFLNNKKMIKEGKANPWEVVYDNIAVRESDYKGSNDVSRMRAVIIARKNDQPGQTNSTGFI